MNRLPQCLCMRERLIVSNDEQRLKNTPVCTFPFFPLNLFKAGISKWATDVWYVAQQPVLLLLNYRNSFFSSYTYFSSVALVCCSLYTSFFCVLSCCCCLKLNFNSIGKVVYFTHMHDNKRFQQSHIHNNSTHNQPSFWSCILFGKNYHIL